MEARQDAERSARSQVAPNAANPIRVGGDVKAPVALHRVDAVYPEAARVARASGFTILECVIDKHGNVVSARILKPLPYGLDEAAVDAVKQWTFKPGTWQGEPVDVLFDVTVNVPLPRDR